MILKVAIKGAAISGGFHADVSSSVTTELHLDGRVESMCIRQISSTEENIMAIVNTVIFSKCN